MTFTPVQKLSITSGAALLMLSAVGLVSYLSTTQMVDAQRAAAVTNQNIEHIDRVSVRSMTAETAIHSYVENGNAAMLGVIDAAQSDVEYALDSLRAASEDHPAQRANLDKLGPILGAQFIDGRHLMLIRTKSGAEAAAKALRKEPPRTSPSRLLAEMRNEEVRVLGEKSRVMVESGKSTRIFIVVGSIFSLSLAALALQPLRPSVGRRLTQRLSQTMIAIGDDEETPGPR